MGCLVKFILNAVTARLFMLALGTFVFQATFIIKNYKNRRNTFMNEPTAVLAGQACIYAV